MVGHAAPLKLCDLVTGRKPVGLPFTTISGLDKGFNSVGSMADLIGTGAVCFTEWQTAGSGYARVSNL